MTITLDTNVLVYSVDDRFPEKRDICRQIVDIALDRRFPIALQVCGELFRVLTGRLGMSPQIGRRYATVFLDALPTFSPTAETMKAALDCTVDGRLSFWDAHLVSVAEAAGCTHLISEDMHDGFRFGRLQVLSPFSGTGPSARVRDLLSL